MGKEIKSEIDWTWSQDTLKAIISRIIERRDAYEKEVSNDIDTGIVMGLNFAIDMIRNDLEGRGYDFKEFMSEDE